MSESTREDLPADLKWPTISLVTPSFNQGRFVRQTVDSVLSQEYSNLEYLFCDGGSTDQTLAEIEPVRTRLTYFQSAPDAGQADAIAQGFSRSTGEIMGWLNSDDVLAPGALAFVAKYFAEHPDIDAIYSHRCIIDEAGIVRSYWMLPEHCNYLMRRWDMIPQETCFWRRSLYERAGGVDSKYQFALDYDLFVRMMKLGKFVRVNRFLGAFRKHDSAKTRRLLKTTGRAEIRAVRSNAGVRIWPGEQAIGAAFFRWVLLRSWLYARRGKSLPGAMPGTGHPYHAIWEDHSRRP